jgi:glycosyltransferase involved in cell wall biosynthesis
METICILPRKLGLGGPASFQARLSAALRQQGVQVTYDPTELGIAAILVVGGTRHFEELQRAKRRGVRIVQRLNGMNWVHKATHTSLLHFFRAEINNSILKTIRSRYADAIVYQSKFSYHWWKRVYGAARVPESVIYNGVDMNEFSPAENSERPADFYRMLLVEGHFGSGYEGGLFTAAKAANLLSQRLPKPLQLTIVGDAPQTLREAAQREYANIDWRGVVKREDIPAIDRSAHLMFSSDVNAACPNSVIEAMACGLPVVGYDTGSLRELVANGAGEVAAYGSDVWKLMQPDIYALVDAAQQVFNNSTEYSQRAREQAINHFDVQEIAAQYGRVLLEEKKNSCSSL